jgi:hypothetical protein
MPTCSIVSGVGLVKPFSCRFSPFSTVFPTTLIRESFDDAGVGPFPAPYAPFENSENGERSGRLQIWGSPNIFPFF